MANEAPAVRKHNGDRYGGSATKARYGKRESAVPKGTVTVREKDSPRLPAPKFALRKREEPDVLEWTTYRGPRHLVLYRKEVSRAFEWFLNRKRDFRYGAVRVFVDAVRGHFKEHNVNQCPASILAKARYPLNPEKCTFFKVRVGREEFIVPTSFFAKREPPVTNWRKPKKVKEKKT